MSDWDEDTPVFDLEEPRVDASAVDERPYLIVLVGTHVGEMVKLDEGSTLLGRGEGSAVHVFDDSASRRHAVVRVSSGDTTLEDLGSRNGTWVNGERINRHHKLRDGDKIQIGSTTILKFTYHDHLEESFQRNMFESALRDGLTKAFNKRYFLERLESEVRFARRHAVPLSLVLFDIDHFKKVNDTFGHVTGDHVLASLARKVHDVIRNEDVFARYGGEEFVVLLRSIDLVKAIAFGERLRRTIEKYTLSAGQHRFTVTVSVGVSALPEVKSDEPLALIAAADEALYSAKNGGRNCVRGMTVATVR